VLKAFASMFLFEPSLIEDASLAHHATVLDIHQECFRQDNKLILKD